jgi:Zinc finger C-x8-C-x5-C-x3-H type (and similar)
MHIAEKHVYCTVASCDFHARPEVMIAHKIAHLKDDGQQTSVVDSSAETAAWLAARRAKFPAKTNRADEPAPEAGKLERAIRAGMRQAQLVKKQLRERLGKQPCSHWEAFGKCKYGDDCKFEHPKQGICEFFSSHGRCRHGDKCKYEHLNKREQAVAAADNSQHNSQLMKKLLLGDTMRFESQILQAIRYCVDQNFFEAVNPVTTPEDAELSDDLGSVLSSDSSGASEDDI